MSLPAEIALDQSAADRLRFERLEYGKLCVSPDGPILPGGEAHRLFQSPRFPPALAQDCWPGRLEVGYDSRRETRHATVIRPVLGQERSSLLAYRLRQRPEDGEGGRSRRYWLGRYLYLAAGGASPSQCFQALDRDLLSGIDRPEQLTSSIEVSVVKPEELDFGGRHMAMVFILSGIPTVFLGPIEERTFFEWATSIWKAIPKELRALFSTAWGIAPVLCPGYCFSCSTEAPDSVAAYDFASGQWRRPRTLVASSRAFKEGHLVPGHEYWGAVRSEVQEQNLKRRLEAEPLALERPTDLQAFDLPDFYRPSLYHAFRKPGLVALDLAREADLRAWLEGKDLAEQELALQPDHYLFATSRQEAFVLALDHLEESPSRATRLLWRFCCAEFLPEPKASPRLPFYPALWALLSRLADHPAVRNQTVPPLLHALAHSMDLADLAPEVTKAWQDSLHQGLHQSREALAHLEMILQDDRNPHLRPYWQWVEDHDVEVAAALCLQEPTAEVRNAIASISGWQNASGLVHLLVRWYDRSTPPRHMEKDAVAAEPERARKALTPLWESWWGSSSQGSQAKERESLLPWIELLEKWATKDPVLRLAFEGNPSAELTSELIPQLECGNVPPCLEAKLAAALVRWWPALYPDKVESILEHRIFTFLPKAHCVALGVRLREVKRRRASEVDEAFRCLDPPEKFLYTRLHSPEKFRRPGSAADKEGAAWLWNSCCRWAERLTLFPPTAPAICAALDKDRLTDLTMKPADIELTAAAGLAKAAGFEIERNQLTQRLGKAPQGWHIRVLLDAVPATPVDLGLHQLLMLGSEERAWVKQHMRDSDVTASRRDGLALIAADFQSLDRRQWPLDPKTVKHTKLWGAFRGLSSSQQGDLGAALNFYAADDTDLYEVSTLIKEYLSWSGGDVEDIVRKVAEVVVQRFLRGLARHELAAVLDWISSGAVHGSNERSLRFSASWFSRSWFRNTIFRSTGSRKEAVIRQESSYYVEDWFVTFLQRFGRWPGAFDELLREYHWQ